VDLDVRRPFSFSLWNNLYALGAGRNSEIWTWSALLQQQRPSRVALLSLLAHLVQVSPLHSIDECCCVGASTRWMLYMLYPSIPPVTRSLKPCDSADHACVGLSFCCTVHCSQCFSCSTVLLIDCTAVQYCTEHVHVLHCTAYVLSYTVLFAT